MFGLLALFGVLLIVGGVARDSDTRILIIQRLQSMANRAALFILLRQQVQIKTHLVHCPLFIFLTLLFGGTFLLIFLHELSFWQRRLIYDKVLL